MAKTKRKAIEMNAELADAAILGLEMKRRELDEKIAELRLIANKDTSRAYSQVAGKVKRRRSFSAASRKKMADAQRKRWAAIKKNSTGSSSKASGKPGSPAKKNKAAKKTVTTTV